MGSSSGCWWHTPPSHLSFLLSVPTPDVFRLPFSFSELPHQTISLLPNHLHFPFTLLIVCFLIPFRCLREGDGGGSAGAVRSPLEESGRMEGSNPLPGRQPAAPPGSRERAFAEGWWDPCLGSVDGGLVGGAEAGRGTSVEGIPVLQTGGCSE